jgi:2-polyprenyl-6-methoxyphenol hydroxylase-like FAD-dependent oxidoreductase
MDELAAECCVVGGGPAGMMLGLLLARAGVEVVVLEKHRDFLRDFRGDTIHPSTMEVLHELGLLEDFLKLSHQEARLLSARVGDAAFPAADFSRLRAHCRFIAFMPQWDFLDFLAAKAQGYPNFRLLLSTEANALLADAASITGVAATGPDGPVSIRAALVVGADGRSSIVRAKAALRVDERGAPMDVLWFRLSRLATDSAETLGRFDTGRILIMINRGEYWQCGYVIAKGSLDDLRQRGLDEFRAAVGRLEPLISDRVSELRDWDDIKLLTVQVDRLRKWYRPGLLCIGDAAHAMSPVGGVGINLAIQDAVATANIVAPALRQRRLTTEHLRMVQQRRTLPTRIIQALQLAIQKRVIARVLGAAAPLRAPLGLRLAARLPFLQRMNARVIGMGIRPEHVTNSVLSGADRDPISNEWNSANDERAYRDL